MHSEFVNKPKLYCSVIKNLIIDIPQESSRQLRVLKNELHSSASLNTIFPKTSCKGFEVQNIVKDAYKKVPHTRLVSLFLVAYRDTIRG